MRSPYQYRGFIVLLFVILTAVTFQNCSSGFKAISISGVNNQSSNGSVNPPTVVFSTISDYQSASTMVINYAIQMDPQDSIATVTCTLNSLPIALCNATSASIDTPIDRDYLFEITIKTQLNLTAILSRSIRRDAIQPQIIVSSPPAATTSETSAQFIFTASDNFSGVKFSECAIDTDIFTVCTSPHKVDGLGSGPHTAKIRTTDLAGNISLIYNYAWTINTSMPFITLSETPLAATNLLTAKFSFSGAGITNYQCKLDDEEYAPCVSPYPRDNLAVKSHTFRVTGKNAAGVTSAEKLFTWIIDNVKPALPILASTATGTTNLHINTVTFSSTDIGSGIASYQCAFDTTIFTACTSPRNLVGVVDGPHTLKVKALDVAGNLSDEASTSWTVDGTAPVITFSQMPLATTTQTTLQFTFTVTDTGGTGVNTIQCSLDNNETFSACTSPYSTPVLALGNHNLRLRATDTIGNMALVTTSWAIQTQTPTPTPTPPNPPIAGTACATSSGVASYFDCSIYFNLNISGVVQQEVDMYSSAMATYYTQLVCGTLFSNVACPSKISKYNSTSPSSWTSVYSNTLLNNFGNTFGPNGLQISNSISIYLNSSTQRTYTVDTAGGWLATASDIYAPYTSAASKTAAVIPAPPAASGQLPGFSSLMGETCDGSGCYYIVLDAVKSQLIEIRGANIVAGKMSGVKTTVNRSKAISLSPTMMAWNLKQALQLNGNATPDDIFGYYQRDHCPSADGAGLMVAPLTITAAELNAGAIKHALRFVIPNRKAANYSYVRPATHYPDDASNNLSNWLTKLIPQPATNAGLPYGSLLRLLPACKAGVTASNPPKGCINLPSNITAYDQVVITALQNYGMYLADSTNDAGNSSITATTDVDSTKFSAISSLLPRYFEVMPTPGPFNPADIYHLLAETDYAFFTGSDSNGSPVIAWSSGGDPMACVRKAPASGLMTW